VGAKLREGMRVARDKTLKIKYYIQISLNSIFRD
jgi:hypothetical protein